MNTPAALTLTTPAEHPFAQFVRILGKGKRGARNLTREEAHEAMGMLLDEKTEEAQLGAFLMLLRHKEESPQELAGFVDAVRERLSAAIFRRCFFVGLALLGVHMVAREAWLMQ